jgi:hypothetical protein
VIFILPPEDFIFELTQLQEPLGSSVTAEVPFLDILAQYAGIYTLNQ